MDDFDLTVGKIGIVVSVLLLGLRFVAAQVFLLVIPLAAGLGSAFYVSTRRHERVLTFQYPGSPKVMGYFPALVFGALAVLILWTASAGVRTDMIYLWIGLIGAAIIVQILFVEDSDLDYRVVLVQILVAAVLIRLSALYVTPGYVGVDIWAHATVFVDGIVDSGSLSPLAGNKYLMAPFYHVVGAIGALFFGGVRNGIYLWLGILVPLSAVFVFLTAELWMPTRWALAATALFAFADQFIRWGMHIIPTSLGLVLFVATVYLVTRILRDEARTSTVFFLLVVSVAIVFIHQVSTAITLVFLGISAAVVIVLSFQRFDHRPSKIRRKAVAIGGVFVITLVTTVVSWANTPFGGNSFLLTEFGVLRRVIVDEAAFLNLASSGSGGSGQVTQTLMSQLVPYIELVGFGLLLFTAVIGGLVLLSGRIQADIAWTNILTTGTMFVVVFGLSMFGIRVLLPGRWMAFLFASMVLLGAYGLYHLAESASPRLVLVVFLVVALAYPTTMVVAEKATLDSPAFENEFPRFAYTESEIGAVETMRETYPPGMMQGVATDHPYKKLWEHLGGYDATTARLEVAGPVDTRYAVVREYQQSAPVSFRDSEGSYVTPTYFGTDPAVCPESWQTVYANDHVKLCHIQGALGGDA